MLENAVGSTDIGARRCKWPGITAFSVAIRCRFLARAKKRRQYARRLEFVRRTWGFSSAQMMVFAAEFTGFETFYRAPKQAINRKYG